MIKKVLFVILAFFMLIVTSAGALAVITEADVIAWYDLEEGSGNQSADSSGKEGNITFHNGPSWSSLGVPANLTTGIDLDGVNQYGNFSRNLLDNRSTASVVIWYQPDGDASNQFLVSDRGTASRYTQIVYGGGDGFALTTRYDNGTVSFTMASTTVAPTTKTIFGGYTVGGTGLNLSIDTVNEDSDPYSDGIINNDNNELFLGQRGNDGSYVNGRIYQVIFLNKKLSKAELDSLFSNNGSVTYDDFFGILPSGIPSIPTLNITANDYYNGSSIKDFNVSIEGYFNATIPSTNQRVVIDSLSDLSLTTANKTELIDSAFYNVTTQSIFVPSGAGYANLTVNDKYYYNGSNNVSFHINFDTDTTSTQFIYIYNNPSNYGLQLRSLGTGDFQLVYAVPSGTYTCTSTLPRIDDGVKHTATGIFNEETDRMYLYQDGVLACNVSVATVTPYDFNHDEAHLGAREFSVPTSTINGNLYRFIAYDRRLSKNEIDELGLNKSVYGDLLAYYDYRAINVSSLNLTVTANNYFNNSFTTVDQTFITASLIQAYASFFANNAITGTSVTHFTASVSNPFAQSNYGVIPVLNLSAGQYDVSFFKIGYYNSSIQINVSSLSNDSYNFSVFDARLNITAFDFYDNSSLNNFSGWIANNTYGLNYSFNTTSGLAKFNLTKGNYTVYIEANRYIDTPNNRFNQEVFALSNELNKSMVPHTKIYAETIFLQTISNFSIESEGVNYTTSNSVVNLPLYNGTFNVTIYNAELNGTYYESVSIILNASPTLENYTFTLFYTNSFVLTFYNETTNLLLNGTNVTWQIISSLEARNGTTSNGSVTEVFFTPGNYEIIYYEDPIVRRSYFITLTNQSAETIRLYTLDPDESNLYLPIVTDSDDQACPDNIVSLMRYYIDVNGYRVVEMATTDTNGKAVLHVQPNEINYKLMFEGSCGSFTSDPQKIVLETEGFTVTEAQGLLTSSAALQNAQVTFDYINATQTYVFTWADTSNVVTSGCMYVYREFQAQKTTNYTACLDSNAGSLIYTLTGNLTNTKWSAKGVLTTNTEFSTYSYRGPDVEFLTSVEAWGLTGVFWALILILAITLTKSQTAGGIVFSSIGSLIVLISLGIVAGGGGVIGGLLILMVIVLYKLRTS